MRACVRVCAYERARVCVKSKSVCDSCLLFTCIYACVRTAVPRSTETHLGKGSRDTFLSPFINSSCVEPRVSANPIHPEHRVKGMAQAGQLDVSRLVVPALLMLGWIVGCAVVVYWVFN
ncbi:uncharacterized protein [Paramormyrops kingsleyae]|uniref:uncharacterized protein isoform X2 n=1 Tax=Paramormyrops kingsleyae TaxID=1676925 RepID=UPI003B976700